ncbi:glucose-inducible SAM-dependent methyltransferase Rrg1 protein [Rutstroemia sp. NJR-2017a WRK4]|nr:glucose-inducible SAM-dependent methyltransferase Rrg1 protein [Rutstroemia sp. NJR-2017a WRK4]
MPSNESLDGATVGGFKSSHKPIHSFDLPQLHRKPSFSELFQTLSLLRLQPPSWDTASRPSTEDDAQGISRYLTRLIGSDLHWFYTGVNEEEAEARIETIHELASKRLAERCGRSAMPQMIRTWTIPASEFSNELNVELCEPPLTGDSLGLKTWGTSFVMARKLEELSKQYLSHLLCKYAPGSHDANTKVKVLELGAGTGLLGITAALLWEQDVVLTDLPDIVPNLQANVKKNGLGENTSSTGTRASILDWTNAENSDVFSQNPEDKFEIILVSDPFYDTQHPGLLAGVIPKYLKELDGRSRVIVSVPLRDAATRAMKDDFESLMKKSNYELLVHGRERCLDDWEESAQDENDSVYCWWSIWKPIS